MSNSTIGITVVMPSLNQGAFLAQSLESVLSQDVDGLELVVMDGGSTDGSLDRLMDVASRSDGQVRWFSAPDGGPAQAVNAAVRLARGGVAGWLNADDFYAPGAIRRALEHLSKYPQHVMVYGQAAHVDLFGGFLARYPTRVPETDLAAFLGGCFISQPSVFIRRETWQQLGGLDESLAAAFDFDLWLRVFQAFPGRVGFVDVLQASSRLHQGAITSRLRRRVIFESMEVLRRHLGGAPLEWCLTHVEELIAAHPFEDRPTDLPAAVAEFASDVTPSLRTGDVAVLKRRLAEDRRLQLASPYCSVTVHPDGWTDGILDVRVRQPPAGAAVVVIHGRHASPAGGALNLSVAMSDGDSQRWCLTQRGLFRLQIPLTDQRRDARSSIRIKVDGTFVPANVEPRSDDHRSLGFLVERVELIPASKSEPIGI